jgi:hypothetical protein
MPWFTITETKLVWAPIGTCTNKKGEVKTKFVRLGVKVTMADGTHWFYSFKHDSWTKHFMPVRKLDRLGRPAEEAGKPVFLPARKDRYTATELQREWGRRKPELVSGLYAALENAETVED